MGSSQSQPQSIGSNRQYKPFANPHMLILCGSKKSLGERSSLSSDDQLQLPPFEISNFNVESAFYREPKPKGPSKSVETSHLNVQKNGYGAKEETIPLPKPISKSASQSNPYSADPPSFANLNAFKRGSLRITNAQVDSPVSSHVSQSVKQRTLKREKPPVNVDTIGIMPDPSDGVQKEAESTSVSKDNGKNETLPSSNGSRGDGDRNLGLSRRNSATYWRQTAIRARSNRIRISWVSDDGTQYRRRSVLYSGSQTSQNGQGREDQNTDGSSSPNGSFTAGDDNQLNSTTQRLPRQSPPHSKEAGHRTVSLDATSQFGDVSRKKDSMYRSVPLDSTSQYEDMSRKKDSIYRNIPADSTSQYRDMSRKKDSMYRSVPPDSTSQFGEKSRKNDSMYQNIPPDSTSQSGDMSRRKDSVYRSVPQNPTSQYGDISRKKGSKYRNVSADSTSEFGDASQKAILVQSELTTTPISFRESTHKHRRHSTKSESFNSEVVLKNPVYPPQTGAYSPAPIRNFATYYEGLYPEKYSTDHQLYYSVFPKAHPRSIQLPERPIRHSVKESNRYKRMSFPSTERPVIPSIRDITCPSCSHVFPSVDAVTPARNPQNLPETKRRASVS